MKRWMLMGVVLGGLCVPVLGAASFSDDFETGTDGWNTWPGATDHLNLDDSHNITPGYQTTPGNPAQLPAGHSFRASEGEPGGFASYAQYADGTGFVRAQVYVYADNAAPDADDSRLMLQLTQGVGFGTDYMQLGVLQDYAGGQNNFSVRTAHRDGLAQGTYDTGVARPAINGWVKLAIEADSSVGGDLRFYVNDSLVYTDTSGRQGNNLDTLRLGVNFGNNHDTFWYDDVLVTPEPASLLLLATGGLILRRRAAR